MSAGGAAAGVHGHPLAVARVPRDGGVNGSRFRRDHAHGNGEVFLVELAVLELLGEALVGCLGLGHDHQAGGVEIEPVHDAGPELASDAADVGAPRQQRVDQSAVGVARARVNREAGRLVHHDQVLVLVDGGNRYVLRDQVCGRARRRDAHGYGVAGPDALGGTGDGSVYRDQAVGRQGLQAAAGEAGGGQFRELGQPGIQPGPFRPAVDDEVVAVAGVRIRVSPALTVLSPGCGECAREPRSRRSGRRWGG